MRCGICCFMKYVRVGSFVFYSRVFSMLYYVKEVKFILLIFVRVGIIVCIKGMKWVSNIDFGFLWVKNFLVWMWYLGLKKCEFWWLKMVGLKCWLSRYLIKLFRMLFVMIDRMI